VIPCEWTADHGLWRLITVNGHVITGYGDGVLPDAFGR